MIYKVGDKVVLKHPHEINDFDDYTDDWKELWNDNSATIFTIHRVDEPRVRYYLTYPDGYTVKNVKAMSEDGFFEGHEISKIAQNILDDELFTL